ncbi:WhiB family transcriptional regulator [Lentzea sp. DG1S-22]|uniref:WhiB family transcriptional regulator n=1 Tax=Lentzea sp. DG1S-22 TaxID=3108822 RepID=UPI002E7A5605|nr:WhiB family transcriptional regulator [Lentzea sp. DG1S-22]WVH78318.1 WhiB family transcriptional regulator [Lentzea sp. DG1S-22]
MNPENYYEVIAAELDRYAKVPDAVLMEIVTRDGTCMWLWSNEKQPEWQGEEITDRELAACLCEPCPVRRLCLEWELRLAGEYQFGVCGGLTGEDRRALYRVWRARRKSMNEDQDGGQQS